MANWCNNLVFFRGTPGALEQIQKLFKAMAEKEKMTYKGFLSNFLTLEKDGCFFEIYCNDNHPGIFQYETISSPNIEAVQKIAQFYGVDFILDYEEKGRLLYGRATFRGGVLSDVRFQKKFSPIK